MKLLKILVPLKNGKVTTIKKIVKTQIYELISNHKTKKKWQENQSNKLLSKKLRTFMSYKVIIKYNKFTKIKS